MMSSSAITAPTLAKVKIDLDNAKHALGTVWAADDHDAINHLNIATEALLRAVASVSYAVERLAELPVCDGSH